MGTHRGGHNCHDRQEQARHGVLGGWRWSAWKGGQIFRAYVLMGVDALRLRAVTRRVAQA